MSALLENLTWQQGGILFCVVMLIIAAVSLRAHGHDMRRRQRQRDAWARFYRMRWDE